MSMKRNQCYLHKYFSAFDSLCKILDVWLISERGNEHLGYHALIMCYTNCCFDLNSQPSDLLKLSFVDLTVVGVKTMSIVRVLYNFVIFFL